ncbi:hypothetical protein BDV36DRAFT_309563 [Aspergillus pseudocaelatus]|uniref:Aminoglycoside phosphotransferase domain-containing protein n=1 Tax=Aspergillus pseudocaelatus TaxID=1825620 RepID=A0ABQ6WJF4_9EURO|nr:hypothetical protein BDV36DRAFT_309563 [Aspergillus pseudocaelatus]
MDRARGTTLDVVWKELGWFMTAKFGLQLHRFVKILRSVTSPTAGSLATGECWSFWLEDHYGFPANSGQPILPTSSDSGRTLHSSDFTVGWPMTIEPFILTHHDLAPRNLLYASMYNINIPQDWGLMAPLRWHLFAWIAIGYHEADARLLRKMRSKLT